MIRRFVFIVERKTGKMPEISWKKVLEIEREFSIEDERFLHYCGTEDHPAQFSVAPSIEDVINVLHFLYPGEHRVLVVSD